MASHDLLTVECYESGAVALLYGADFATGLLCRQIADNIECLFTVANMEATSNGTLELHL